MTKPVTIRYHRPGGPPTEVRLHQPGHAEQWVLDLLENHGDGLERVHQHAIDGEPEVSIG